MANEQQRKPNYHFVIGPGEKCLCGTYEDPGGAQHVLGCRDILASLQRLEQMPLAGVLGDDRTTLCVVLRSHLKDVEQNLFKVNVNGREVELNAPFGTIGYEEFCLQVDRFPDRLWTITFSRGSDNQREGSLTRGHIVVLKDGMLFNIADTSNA